MAKTLTQSLEVGNRIDATPFARILTAIVEGVGALAAMTRGRRRQAAEPLLRRDSREDARLEFERFLYW